MTICPLLWLFGLDPFLSQRITQMPHSSMLCSGLGLLSGSQPKESYKSRMPTRRDTGNRICIPLLRTWSWELITSIHIPKGKRDSNSDIPKLPILTNMNTLCNQLHLLLFSLSRSSPCPLQLYCNTDYWKSSFRKGWIVSMVLKYLLLMQLKSFSECNLLKIVPVTPKCPFGKQTVLWIFSQSCK